MASEAKGSSDGRDGGSVPSDKRRADSNVTPRRYALGSSAGVRGHGAAGRAGGTAPTARSQTSPFHIGMGEATETASDGGAYTGDGGARDARAVRRRGREARPAAQHTAARRRVRTRRTFTVTSPLSASRADEKQLPAAAEQVRERRAGVGDGGERCARGERGGRGGDGGCGGGRRQEGRSAAEGDALVGAHGRAHGRGGRRGRGAVRDGAPARAAAAPAPRARARRRARPARAARRLTPRATTSRPYHAYIPLSGRERSPGVLQTRPPAAPRCDARNQD